MSRSFRKTPICGWTMAKSNKEGKIISSRRLRHAQKRCLSDEWDDMIIPIRDDVYNRFDLPKEGKNFFNPEEWPKLMRK